MSDSAVADPRLALFDEAWYRMYAPPFEGGAFEHFVSIGWVGGLSPHPLFDVEFYLAQLAEPLAEGDDPLSHFLREGAAGGLDPHPLFDTTYYVSRYEDSLDGMNPLTHQLTRGWTLGYDPHPLFNLAFYGNGNPGVGENENPLLHYAKHGARATFQPHPLFDGKAYAKRKALATTVNPLADFIKRLRGATPRQPPEDPVCSVVILNYNKALLTLQAVVDALESDGAERMEIVLVDNGSAPDDFSLLASMTPPCVRLVRLQSNRFFGEGNNIGVEASRGRYILFLNNDAFLEKTTVTKLIGVLQAFTDAGAAGPKFLYPNGEVQEAGSFVSPDGAVVQRGKRESNQSGRFEDTERVDYISAACLLMLRADFDEIGGFDLMWDPAYYEDVDLCLKLRSIGKRTYYCGAASVTHIENGTSSDASLGLKLGNIVEVNRSKFVSRWGTFIDSGGVRAAPRIPPRFVHESGRQSLGVAALYTPYPLYPGGGERYILSIAEALSKDRRTFLITPERYSQHRLRTIANELDLRLDNVELLTQAQAGEAAGCDVFFAMGNELFPPVPALGRRNFFICQFPFPMHPSFVAEAWGRLAGYDSVIVYSEFAKRNYRKRAAEVCGAIPPISILPPPVPNCSDDYSTFYRDEQRILSVGRFTSMGHCKRQDTLIEAFVELTRLTGKSNLELHLVGSVAADGAAREYALRLRNMARGFPIYFHLNASPNTLRHLYGTSGMYWHGAGYGVLEHHFPERLEHFGISVLEAMSAGAIPFVCANGGPASIVRDGETGFHWRTPSELAAKAHAALSLAPAARCLIRTAGAGDAEKYDEPAFESRLAALLNEWGVAHAAPSAGLLLA